MYRSLTTLVWGRVLHRAGENEGKRRRSRVAPKINFLSSTRILLGPLQLQLPLLQLPLELPARRRSLCYCRCQESCMPLGKLWQALQQSVLMMASMVPSRLLWDAAMGNGAEAAPL